LPRCVDVNVEKKKDLEVIKQTVQGSVDMDKYNPVSIATSKRTIKMLIERALISLSHLLRRQLSVYRFYEECKCFRVKFHGIILLQTDFAHPMSPFDSYQCGHIFSFTMHWKTPF
jgi:hypothetical protein